MLWTHHHRWPIKLSKMSRSSNFNDDDKAVFTSICRRHPIIEDKRYISSVLQKKHDAWAIIELEFNSNFPGRSPRDVKSLQGLYKRMKNCAKGVGGSVKKFRISTGGGPSASTAANIKSSLGDSENPTKKDDGDSCTDENSEETETGQSCNENGTADAGLRPELSNVPGSSTRYQTPCKRSSQSQMRHDINWQEKRGARKRKSFKEPVVEGFIATDLLSINMHKTRDTSGQKRIAYNRTIETEDKLLSFAETIHKKDLEIKYYQLKTAKLKHKIEQAKWILLQHELETKGIDVILDAGRPNDEDASSG